ncbi:MAG: VWA domain-containing protein [Planctomycetales bacterium]|nr:VWA domain-containing protein [Planctomycetales bacterium]
MADRTMHAVSDSLDPSPSGFANDLSSGDCLSEGERRLADSLSPLTAATAVARGTLLLSLLSQQAAAARAEAQCTELRLLLGEARQGESLRLQRWLQAHAAEHPLAGGAGSPNTDDSTLDVDVSSPATNTPVPISANSDSSGNRPAAERPPADAGSAASAAQPLDSWETLLAPAQARLIGHAQRLRCERLRVQQPCSESIPVNPTQHRRLLRWSRLRGVVASVAVHGMLVFVLAWITLRMPTPPASLGLVASPVEWRPDAMEITQPTQLSQPDVADASNPANAAFDLSETLTDVANDVGAALGTHPVSASSSLPSGSRLAASSAASKLMQSNAIFYGAAACGNCFCYIIDGSGSMRNGPWDAAKHELLKSLATLKEKQRFYIIFFNCELSAIPLPGEQTPAPAALYATPDNLTHTRRWLDTLRIDRGAPPIEALELAISKEPDAIYLLTDGATTVDVPKFLRDSNRITDLIFGEQVRVPIHTIAFYSLDGQAMLKQIAAENEGQFVYVPNPRR